MSGLQMQIFQRVKVRLSLGKCRSNGMMLLRNLLSVEFVDLVGYRRDIGAWFYLDIRLIRERITLSVTGEVCLEENRIIGQIGQSTCLGNPVYVWEKTALLILKRNLPGFKYSFRVLWKHRICNSGCHQVDLGLIFIRKV